MLGNCYICIVYLAIFIYFLFILPTFFFTSQQLKPLYHESAFFIIYPFLYHDLFCLYLPTYSLLSNNLKHFHQFFFFSFSALVIPYQSDVYYFIALAILVLSSIFKFLLYETLLAYSHPFLSFPPLFVYLSFLLCCKWAFTSWLIYLFIFSSFQGCIEGW